MHRLLKVLKQQCAAERVGDLDLQIAFVWPDGECNVCIHPRQVYFIQADQSKRPMAPRAELILYFSSEGCAIDVLQGRYNPIDAFMNEDFKSNGYIMWAFQCLAIFSSTSAANIASA